MRSLVGILVAVGACGAPPPPPVAPKTPIANTGGQVAEKPELPNIDAVFDIDQAREHDPATTDWTVQRYVGPKQYERMFVEIKYRGPQLDTMDEHPKGPMAKVDRIELLTGFPKPVLFTTLDHGAFTYAAQNGEDFADDRGEEMFLQETMRVQLKVMAGFVQKTHPFYILVRGRAADGKLVFEHQLYGDEADKYAEILPGRPY